MLAVSRSRGESMMIGDNLLLTVNEVRGKKASLSCSRRLFGGRFEFLDVISPQTVEPRQTIELAPMISCTLLDVCGGRARLGFKLPAGVSLHRKEVYDAIHGV